MAAIATMLVGLSTPALGEDWPKWRGPNSNGISPEKGINKDWKAKPPKKLWDVPMRDKGHAGPAVADGRLFIVDHEGENDVVRAIDLKTGQDLWQFPYPEKKTSDHGYARMTPLIEGDRVYTTSRFGVVNCLNAKTGEKIWSRDLFADFKGKGPTWGIAMSPVIDGEKLIVCPGSKEGSVAALDKMTGKTIWHGGGGYGLGYATPVIATLAGKKQYLVFMGLELVGIDAADGKELWKHRWRAVQNTATPIVTQPDHVFITTWYSKKACALLKITDNGPEVVWENENLMSKINTPILFDGHLYGNNSATGNLVCIDAKTGELKWQQPGFEHGGQVAADGVLIAVDGEGGEIVMLEMSPRGYNELGRTFPFAKGGNNLRGNVWAPPIIADGKLLARDRNRLVCLDLK
jgi:outer membrane protein assembly factor BamB